MTEIKTITAKATFTVRHAVLRPGKPIESCHFEGDERASTTHFGYFEAGHLQGVASLFAANDADFETTPQAQLRGMAVLEGQQGKGIGKQLLEAATVAAVQQGKRLLWFNARESALSFYRRNGFEIFGQQFEITGVGPHYKMFKTLA